MNRDEKAMYDEIIPVWFRFVQANGSQIGRAGFRDWLRKSKHKVSERVAEKIDQQLSDSFIRNMLSLVPGKNGSIQA